jgi:outer membrane receptor protein involved in Fe transport
MNTSTFTYRRAILTTWIVAPLCTASAAWAQDATKSDPPDVSTVVVTALKTPRAMLDTAASVSVVSASDLNVANVTSAQQLSSMVPGYFAMQGTAGTSASFRGLGSNSSDPSIESSVGMFVDGIYLGHTRDYTMPLFDVNQIEFIAGSESTVLGKNTSLGAISVSNRRPDHVFGYNASYTHTSDIDGDRLEAGVNIPITNQFAMRVVGFLDHDHGIVDNDYLKRREPRTTVEAGRIVLQGNIGDSSSLLVSYQHDQRRVTGEALQMLTDPDQSITNLAANFGQTKFNVGFNDTSYSGSTRLDPTAPAASLPYDNQVGDRATAIVESDLAGGFNITGQTSFVHWNSPRVTDLDFTAFDLFDLIDHEDNRMFSQEIRLTSPKNDKFNYIAGFFYYNDKYSLNRSIGSDLGFALNSYLRVKDSSESVFASGSYDLSKEWGIRGGARQTWESKTPTYDVAGTPDVVVTPIPPTTLPAANETETDGNIGLDFRPNKETLLYANWARGSKGGGFQSDPDSLAVARYRPEIAYTTELGAKLNFRKSGYVQFAVFDTIVDGFQTGRVAIVPPSINPQTIITNSNVRSSGVEISGAWSATESISLNGNMTYDDARFTQNVFNQDSTGAQAIEIYKGMPLPRAPRFMALAGVKYRASVGRNIELISQGTIRRTSSADLQFRSEHALSPKSDAHTTLDLQVTLANKVAGWSISLLGNNLTDSRYATFASEHLFDGNAYYGALNRPRTVAVRLEIEK